MAGEWIKLEATTLDKPEVLRIARTLKIDRDAALGKLVRLWSWFDANSVDGVVDGVVDDDVDRMCFCPGFAAACVSVGWLVIDESAERIALPNFDRHNGETAKQRALKNRRQANWRAGKDGCVDDGASTETSTRPSTKASTREEKRREEEKHRSSSFSDDKNPETGKLELTSAPPADLATRQSERLSQITKDAIETFNASALVKRNGGVLAAVSETVGREKRQIQVRRFIRTARAICVERYGGPAISRDFLVDFWAECHRDDFLAGRKSGGKGHENWLPDFEFLTREDTMLKVYDRAASEDVA